MAQLSTIFPQLSTNEKKSLKQQLAIGPAKVTKQSKRPKKKALPVLKTPAVMAGNPDARVASTSGFSAPETVVPPMQRRARARRVK